MANEYL